MIKFDKVSKTYEKGSFALSDVSFTVPSGQFCVLLGHSGAGKSTLLRMVNGLVDLSGGEITVDETRLSAQTLQSVRRKVSMIHQDFNLSARSSVATNIMSGALPDVSFLRAFLGLFPADVHSKCFEVMELVGLGEEHLKRRTNDLSGGQKQRVGIARSLMLNPRVILADEPIASLDPSASREILSHLRMIAKKQSCTILCCLHQVDLAQEFADRIVGIEGGKVVFDLEPADLDKEALSLIYKNYDDPDGELTIKSSSVQNVINSIRS